MFIIIDVVWSEAVRADAAAREGAEALARLGYTVCCILCVYIYIYTHIYVYSYTICMCICIYIYIHTLYNIYCILYHNVLCYAMPCYTMLCYAMLCYAIILDVIMYCNINSILD